ncbi:MAG: hypothetical protein IKL62_03910 [Clostridia bacterium]|nr:hypothetical protein [Clostridia bacterium]
MKKLLAFILAFVMLCSFAACGNEKGAATNDTPADEISSNTSSEAPKPAILNGTYFLYSKYPSKGYSRIDITSQGVSGDEQYGTMNVGYDNVNRDTYRYSATNNELVMSITDYYSTTNKNYVIIDERNFMSNNLTFPKKENNNTNSLIGSFGRGGSYFDFHEDGTCFRYYDDNLIEKYTYEQKENGLIFGTTSNGVKTAWYLRDGVLYWGPLYIK